MKTVIRYQHVITRRLVVEHPDDLTPEQIQALFPPGPTVWREADFHGDALRFDSISPAPDEAYPTCVGSNFDSPSRDGSPF